LKHVLTIERANRDGWIKPKKSSEVFDRYLADFNDGKPNAPSAKMTVPKFNGCSSSDYNFQHKIFESNSKNVSTSVTQPITEKFEKETALIVKQNVQCYHCRGPHVKKLCLELRDVYGTKRVNACHSSSLIQHQTVELPTCAMGRLPELMRWALHGPSGI
jgi:hypothetical protein